MDQVEKDRRGLLVSGIYGLWVLITAGLAGPAAAYLLFLPKASEEHAWIEVALLEDLPLGIPEEVLFRHNRIDGWKVTSEKSTAWVVKQDETNLVAFRPQCTHLGCAYHWDQKNSEFLCPCHTSTFNLDGAVLTGPAPRPLDRYQVKVEGGKLLLEMSKPPTERA